MDKFVTRAPTWKTISYDAIAAAGTSVKGGANAKLEEHAKPKKTKPLQENLAQNNTSSMNYNADSIKQIILQERDNVRKSLNNSNKLSNCETTQNFGNYLSQSFTSTWVGDADYKNVTHFNNNESNKLQLDLNDPEPMRGAVEHIYIQDENARGDTMGQKFGSSTPQTKRTMALKADSLARMQRDLLSPSASVRLRAIRALRSPAQAGGYENFDVPLAEQTIITQEERVPQEPPKLDEILKDVVVYVEVRSGVDNRSEGVKKVIAALGARVNDRLLRNTSHVVFKDGLLSTYKKAVSWNIPVVSILWIEGCKNRLRLCDPKEFPISNLDQYENPELYPKMARHRNMQPNFECNKPIRYKPATPSSKDSANITPKSAIQNKTSSSLVINTPKSSRNEKSKITQFFNVMGSNTKPNEVPTKSLGLAINENAVESPATKFLNRISAGCFTPLATKINSITCTPLAIEQEQPIAHENISTQTSKATLVLNDKPEANSEYLTKEKVPKTNEMCNEDITNDTHGKRNKRRTTYDATTDTKVNFANSSTTPGPITRRRSLQALNSLADISLTSSTSKSKTAFHSIAEEESNENEKLCANIVTNNNCETMDITDLPKQQLKETTTFKRRTLFAPQTMDITTKQLNEPTRSPILNINVCATMQDRDWSSENVRNSVDKEDVPATAFNSTRLPGSNRAMTSFDISIELINQRISSINEKSRRRSMALIQQNNDGTGNMGYTKPLTPAPPSPTEVRKLESNDSTSSVKKRKLFVPNVEFKPTSPLNSKRKATDEKSAQKRRRTLAVVVPMSDTAEKEVVSFKENTDANETKENTTFGSLTSVPNENAVANKETKVEASPNSSPSNVSTTKKRKLYVPNSKFKATSPSKHKKKSTSESQPRKKHRTTTIVATLVTPVKMKEVPNKESKPEEIHTAKHTKTANKIIMKQNARRSTLDFEQVKRITEKLKATNTNQTVETKDGKEETIPPSLTEISIESNSSVANQIIAENKVAPIAKTSPKRKKKIMPSLVYTNMHQEQVDVIKKAVEKLGYFKVDLNVNENTTHLISLDPRRTINMLRGLMRGVWILQYRWVLDSIRAKAWVREEHYEMRNFSRAVEICRAERQAFGKNYRCELFRHMESFYISSRCKGISVAILKELLTLGNAKLEEYRWRAKYIIGDKRREEDDRVYLSPQWVLDSIDAMQIKRFNIYLMPSSIIVPTNPTYEIRQPIVNKVYQEANFLGKS